MFLNRFDIPQWIKVSFSKKHFLVINTLPLKADLNDNLKNISNAKEEESLNTNL